MSIIVEDLSIIIPAYNEEKRIIPTLDSLRLYIERSSLNIEVIVVDDGSIDNTSGVAEKHGLQNLKVIRLEENQGKFGAIRCGVEKASKEWVLLYDADGATPIEMLDAFLPHTSEAQCIIASRAVKEAVITQSQSAIRTKFGRLGNVVIRKLTGLPFDDTQCGFKLIRSNIAKKATKFMTIDRYAGDIELIYLAQRFGAIVEEVGVEWHDVPVSKVGWMDYPRTLIDLMKIVWNIRRGFYS